MAGVNGIEIKVGQVWRTRGGETVTVVRHDSDDAAYPWCTHTADEDEIWLTNSGRDYESLNCDVDLIELVKDENGFTIWRGGEQPEDTRGTLVVYRMQNGGKDSREADQLCWGIDRGNGYNIVAYKVVEQAEASGPAVKPISWPTTPQPADSATLAEETLSALGWTFDGQAWTEQPRIELVVPTPTMQEPGYELLADVLERAYNQAALGKGKERHANGEPFDEQVMQDGARRFGVGALLFQAFKKSEESQRLPLDRGVNELLGAIVYLAGAVIRREADAQEGGV